MAGEKATHPSATNPPIRRGVSTAADCETAARELRTALHRHDCALAVFFCSTDYDVPRMQKALAVEFSDVPLVGCTSAGEITPAGYLHSSLTGFSLADSDFTAVSARIENVSSFQISRGLSIVKDLIASLDEKHPSRVSGDTFAFLMIDGLSLAEEAVVSSLYSALEDIPLFGGSAGDGLHFNRTYVYENQKFFTDAAVLTLVRTRRRFTVFKTQHFISTDRKMVVTEADPQARIVHEINAEPAGREFARLIGLPEDELTPMSFAAYPVVVKVGGTEHVRSIQKLNEDGSLSFFCAIDKGVVLTVAQGVDIVENLEQVLAGVRAEIGPPEIILGCECVLRVLELEHKQLKQHVAELFNEHNTVGFNTYGEQFHAMHVNQTFTGVAIAYAEEPGQE